MSFTPPPMAGTAPPATTGKALGFTTGQIPPTVPRLVLYAVEGFGKTTIGAHMPGAAIVMARGETGYETLLGEKRVPDCPRVTVTKWDDLLTTLRGVAKEPGDIKTLVLDALGGFERLCHEKDCAETYSGDWDKFFAYGAGIKTSLREWVKLISALDAVNAAGVAILCLAHSQVKTERAVGMPDYDRYIPRLEGKSWDVVNQWADSVLFGTFKANVVGGNMETGSKAKKGAALLTGGRNRVIYTTRADAYDAKNKYAMPHEIVVPDDHTEAVTALTSKITYYTK